MTCVGPIKAVILVDNRAGGDLLAEHGLSVWIEVAGRRMLFDTGQGIALPANAAKLEFDLRSVNTLVLSHGHYDHTGGVPLVVERAPAVHVYCHPAVTGPRHSIRDGVARSIDMPQPTRTVFDRLLPEQLHLITSPVELAPGIGLTGPIPRRTEYEDVGGPFFIDGAGRLADPIDDDLALWMRTEKGLVVIVGCSHAGLVNTLHHACQLGGTNRIHAVLGGFHLGGASEDRLNRTAEALRDIDPDLVIPCHCTGERAVEKLKQALGERVLFGEAGATFCFGEMDRPEPNET
ncbi:MAG: MBL fold metallo-hydrolase [Bradymonadales bacterium]|nr:MBL fold metallo-hydrolase [Bradymonadales bacterium]